MFEPVQIQSGSNSDTVRTATDRADCSAGAAEGNGGAWTLGDR